MNTTPRTIDLNADVGEGAGNDAAVFPWITSANIACGAHAGDPEAMRAAVALAIEHGVAIGAHPGHADRPNFGRREIALGEQDAYRLVVDQVNKLIAIADDRSARIRYVKPHGALYHQAASDAAIAGGVVAAIHDLPAPIALLGPARSELERAAAAVGVRYFREAFADRGYECDGSLASRGAPDALLSAAAAASQAVRIVQHGEVVARGDRRLPVVCDSLCLHGDTPDAAEAARKVADALRASGVTLQAFTA